jgi:3-deoxy-manno-octulosonate cytidylyltransferase (CMP-KDO synthetase)
MDFSVIIPARFAATRLPGKPLLDIAGKPMIQHVYERAMESGAAQVIIATDSAEIEAAAQQFGAQVCMTATSHQSGTDRIAEVAEKMAFPDEHIVVNLQGDEPLMPSAVIHQVAENLADCAAASMSTVCTPIVTTAELFDPHVVKVVMDQQGLALLFSRASIPWDREAFANTAEVMPDNELHFRHIGLYAYRAGFLREYSQWSPCALEQAESLEQLRALWHGHRIHVAEAVEVPLAGVDTEKDLNVVRAVLAAR